MFLSIVIFALSGWNSIAKVESTYCCNTPYPNYKIWIDVSPSVVNYTFYDIMGRMKKMWAYEVDETATVLKNRKIFEATTTSLLCPLGYRSRSPYHDEMTSSWPCRTLCLHKNVDAAQSFKPDKWYVICRENSCQSCNLDKMRNSSRSSKFVNLDSAVIRNDTFTAHLTVLDSGMRYNVSLEPDYVKPSIQNVTINLNQNKAVVELLHVNQTIGPRSTIVMRVMPWLRDYNFPCAIVPDVQYITLYQSDLRHHET